MERLPEELPLLRTADEDEPERTAELPEERTELPLLRATLWAELRVDEVERVDAVFLAGEAFREEADVLEMDEMRDEPALRKALLLRVPDPKADVALLRRRSPCRPLCSGPT